MSFNEHVQNWVALDNHINKLNTRIKELKQTKNDEEKIIFNYVETNNLNNATIKINDGRLKFGSVKQTAPLTFRLIRECLAKFITNEEQVNLIIDNIKEARETKYNPDIKRSYVKKN